MKKPKITALLISIVMLLPSVLALTEGVTAFAASDVTLSGTITLPSGRSAAEGDYVDLVLDPIVSEGAKRIERLNAGSSWNYYDFDAGAKSVKYSVTVPKGTYTLGIEPDAEGISGMQYYTSAGAVHYRELADVIELTANKTVNITLSAPERTISGTITLDEPAYDSGYIYVDAESTDYNSYFYDSIEVSKGQTSVPYSIGVGKGTYILHTNEGQYSIYNDLRDDYESRYYLSTEKGSLSNIDFDFPADSIEYYSGNSSGNEWRRTNITLKLPSGITSDTSLDLRTFSEEGYSTTWLNFDIAAGKTSVTAEKYISPVSDAFYVGIEYEWTVYYYSETNGFTTDRSQATLFTYASPCTIDLSKCYYVISGSVSRNGVNGNEYLPFRVCADAVNGDNTYRLDTYPTAIEKGQSSTAYTLLVPNFIPEEQCSLYILYNTATENDAKILPLQSAVQNLSFPEGCTKKVSGTINLSSPAPKGGVAVQLYYDGAYYGNAPYYVIPKGSSSVNFDVYIVSDSTNINLQTISENSAYSQHTSYTLESDTENNITISAGTGGKTVKGTVRIADPSAMTNAVSFRLYVYVPWSGYGYDICGTIPKGSASMPYSLSIPSDAESVSVGLVEVYSGDMDFILSGDYYDVEIPASGILSNMDFTLSENLTINLTANDMPDLSGINTMEATIVFDNGTERSVQFDSDGKATAVFEKDEIEYANNFFVRFTIDAVDGIRMYDYTMYINPDGSLVREHYEGEPYPAASANINFTVYDNSILLMPYMVNVNNVSYDTHTDKVTVEYSNYGGDEFNAAAIVALYEDGVLTYSKTTTVVLHEDSDSFVLDTELSDNLTPNSTATLMLWNNTGLLLPIDISYPIDINE